jgi:hypothetical protein
MCSFAAFLLFTPKIKNKYLLVEIKTSKYFKYLLGRRNMERKKIGRVQLCTQKSPGE